MAIFTNFSPQKEEVEVSKTSTVSFTILDDGYGVNTNTLIVTFNNQQVVTNGIFVNGYTGKIFSSVGKYVVGVFPKSPSFFPRASKIDIHIEVENNLNIKTVEDYSFYIIGYNQPPEPTIPIAPSRACNKGVPFFPPTDLGLVTAYDAGSGTEVLLSWKEAGKYNQNNIIFYNLYYSTIREDIFDSPSFIVSDTQAKIGGLAPADTHYFAVKAAEFDPLMFTINGLNQASDNIYFYPSSILDGYLLESDMIIYGNTEGFPSFGILHIDTELIRYEAISSSSFIVSENGRGFYNTIAEGHDNNSEIKLYSGKEDLNTKIIATTPTFQNPNYALTWSKLDGYGPDGYRDGYDGYDGYYNNGQNSNDLFDGYDGYYIYHKKLYDSITTDGKANDNSGTFKRLDYCGTWRSMSPYSFMKGQCTPSYFGGAQVRIDAEGNRHLVKVSDAQTHMLQREELLLETTGEPFVLLRRMWTGTHCYCYMNRREHPDARCPNCFNSGFVTGYVQFFNSRRADRRILVRLDPTSDDLNLTDRGGFEPMFEPNGWTLPYPAIKDRDILVRFNEDNTQEFCYEILDTTRVRTLFSQTGAQKFKMKRLPKTSIIYQFPIIRDVRPIPGSIITSVNNGPGLNLHSHNIVIKQDINLHEIRCATLPSENHNHLVIMGVVRPALGHTHTI